jgi:antitoxin CptB
MKREGNAPLCGQGVTAAADILPVARYMSNARPVRAFGVAELFVSGSTRSSNGLDERRRRLLFRSWHRGIREMDLIMGRFADALIAELPERELDDYERLIEVPDPVLFAWLTGAEPAPAQFDTSLLARLRAFHSGAAMTETPC